MTQAVTVRARAMRQALSPPGARLWVALRRLRGEGFHFRRQAPFRGYFLDFVCFGSRVVVEVDGAQHGTDAQLAHDATRAAVLARAGFVTLRFLAGDVLGNIEGVVIAIRAALTPPGALRHPLHKEEGEHFPSPPGEGGPKGRVGP